MKKIIVVLSIVILTIFMVSCNDITKEVAKGEQLRHDISEIESLKHCHRDEFVYDSEFELVDYSIIKRQTNAELKQDVVYCDVEMENQYFKVFLETKLTYNYYDIGGWILDDCEYQKKNVVPIAPAEFELAFAALTHFGKLKEINITTIVSNDVASASDVNISYYKFLKSELIDPIFYDFYNILNPEPENLDDDINTVARYEFWCEFDNLCAECHFDMVFDNKWSIVGYDPNAEYAINAVYLDKVCDTHIDYSEMLGAFRQVYYGSSSYYSYLYIHEINIPQHTVTYRYVDGKTSEEEIVICALDFFDMQVGRFEYLPYRNDYVTISQGELLDRFESKTSIYQYLVGGVPYGHGGLSLPIPNEDDIDENSTLQSNLYNGGYVCEDSDVIYQTNGKSGLVEKSKANGATNLLDSGDISGLCIFNNCLYYRKIKQSTNSFQFQLMRFKRDTRSIEMVYTSEDVIGCLNQINDRLYFFVGDKLFYVDSNGTFLDSGISNVIAVTKSGIYVSNPDGYGLKLLSNDGIEQKRFVSLDNYRVIASCFEYKNYHYFSVIDEETHESYQRLNIADDTLLDVSHANPLGITESVSLYKNKLFISSSNNGYCSIYDAALDGEPNDLYFKFSATEELDSPLFGGAFENALSITGDKLYCTVPYSRAFPAITIS